MPRRADRAVTPEAARPIYLAGRVAVTGPPSRAAVVVRTGPGSAHDADGAAPLMERRRHARREGGVRRRPRTRRCLLADM